MGHDFSSSSFVAGTVMVLVVVVLAVMVLAVVVLVVAVLAVVVLVVVVLAVVVLVLPVVVLASRSSVISTLLPASLARTVRMLEQVMVFLCMQHEIGHGNVCGGLPRDRRQA